MITLFAGALHLHSILKQNDFANATYSTGKLAALQLAGIALGVSASREVRIRNLFDRLVAFARHPLAHGTFLGDVWRVRQVRQQLNAATADLHETQAQYQTLSGNYAEARRQLDVATSTISHLRIIENQYEMAANNLVDVRRQLDVATSTITHLEEQREAAESRTRKGVQSFIDEFQRILFEVPETTSQGRSATVLVVMDQPVNESIATLVNLSESMHGARPFQYVVPFLAPPAPFPLPWPAHMAPLRVVDIGSQELDFENDIFAPLKYTAPVEVVGFDPFAQISGDPDAAVEVHRPDGGAIRTYRHLVADGKPVTFHINRFDATSSTLPANHTLTQPFGLLDLSLQTTEKRELPSRRLDDTAANSAPVDLLKIDVQGASHTVLENGRAVLKRTLVCHVEAEFAPVYLGERLFADIDTLLREEGFSFVDFFSLGRQRYAAFEPSRARAFHRGRTLWADAIYVRALDTPGSLSAEELFRQALIMHVCYNKQDLAAELLGRADALTGEAWQDAYLSNLPAGKTQ